MSRLRRNPLLLIYKARVDVEQKFSPTALMLLIHMVLDWVTQQVLSILGSYTVSPEESDRILLYCSVCVCERDIPLCIPVCSNIRVTDRSLSHYFLTLCRTTSYFVFHFVGCHFQGFSYCAF